MPAFLPGVDEGEIFDVDELLQPAADGGIRHREHLANRPRDTLSWPWSASVRMRAYASRSGFRRCASVSIRTEAASGYQLTGLPNSN